MASRASKFLLGLFVIVGTLIAVIIIIWIGAADFFMSGSTMSLILTNRFKVCRPIPQLNIVVWSWQGQSINVAPDYRLIEVVMKSVG